MAVSVWEKVKEVAVRIKKVASQFLGDFNKLLPKGAPNSYQVGLMTKVLREDGRLGKGQFLTEGKVDKKTINTYLKEIS